MKSSSTWTGLPYVLLASMFWGLSFPANKIALSYVDPLVFTSLRFMVATASILTVAAATSRAALASIKSREIWSLGSLNSMVFVIQILGLQYTSASKSALLLNMASIIVAAISILFFKERPTTSKLLGAILGTTGAAIITTKGSLTSFSRGEIIGDALSIVAAFFSALFIIFNKKHLSQGNGDAFRFTSGVIIVTTIILFPLTFYSANSSPFSTPWQGWTTVIFTGLACTTVPFYLWNRGLRLASAMSSSVVLLFEIVVALVSSAIVLGETLDLVAGTGVLLILLAIGMASR